MKKFIFALLLMFSLVLVACGGDDDNNDVDLPNYPYDDHFNATIVSAEVDGDTVTMTIETIGFHPVNVIRIDVTFENGVITAYEVTDHGESPAWGGVLIDDGDILAAILEYAGNLSALDPADYAQVDEETGATITAEALVDVARAAVEHYNRYFD